VQLKGEREYPNLWLLGRMTPVNDLLHYELECLWDHYLNDGDWPDFRLLFGLLGEGAFGLKLLAKFPFVRNFQKEYFEQMQAYYIENESLHDVVYNDHKDDLIARVNVLLEELVSFFENLELEMSEKLSVDDDSSETCEDHPLYELLNTRSELGFIIIGIRYRQLEEDQYRNVDIDLYERRLTIADFTLKKLALITANRIGYQESAPLAPDDFWWRHMPGYEYVYKPVETV